LWSDRGGRFEEKHIRVPALQKQNTNFSGQNALRLQIAFPGTHVHVYHATHVYRHVKIFILLRGVILRK
jgi:hypothetical protein